MSLILSLIANPLEPALSWMAVAQLASALDGARPAIWLDGGIAAEIPVHDDAPDAVSRLGDIARNYFSGVPIDVAVTPAANRRKRLLVADMDSTMIGQECIDELADFAGLKAEVAAVTERAMRGELPFDEALRDRVALLKGLPVSVIDTVLADRITDTPGARMLVQTMRAHGAHTALVSGGFDRFTAAVAERIGFDSHFANELVVADGKLAGTVAEPIRGRAAKREVLDALCAEMALAPAETMAIGDGANDLDMVRAAGLGVA